MPLQIREMICRSMLSLWPSGSPCFVLSNEYLMSTYCLDTQGAGVTICGMRWWADDFDTMFALASQSLCCDRDGVGVRL